VVTTHAVAASSVSAAQRLVLSTLMSLDPI
jgi:hypothetical protein